MSEDAPGMCSSGTEVITAHSGRFPKDNAGGTGGRPEPHTTSEASGARTHGPAPARLRQWWYGYGPGATLPGAATADPAVLELPLRKYPTKSNLSVVITNPGNGQVLLSRQLVNQPTNRRQGQVPTRKWQEAGIEKIAVEITCHPPRGHFFTDRLLLVLPPLAALR